MKTLPLAALLLLGGCRSFSTADSLQKTDREIVALMNAIIASDNAGAVDAVMDCYDPEAAWVATGREVNGKDNIRKQYDSTFANYKMQMSIDTKHSESFGDLAYADGFVRGSFISKKTNETTPVHDQFWAILRKHGEGWRIYKLKWKSVL